MGDPLRTALDDEIVAALDRLGVEVVAVRSIGLPGLASGRATLRIAAADGRILKVRRATRAEKAARQVRLVRALAGLPLSRILLRRGRVLVEEWIEGTPLDRRPLTPARLRAAADLLAAIHARTTRGQPRRPRRRATAALIAATEPRIARLRAEGALSRSEAAALRAALRDLAPPLALAGLIHNDFCAANLVEDRRGRLHLVDNGGLESGFLELDLARTWARWPMQAAQWSSFLRRYERTHARSLPPEEIRFWQLLTLARSAHFRVSRRSAGSAAALARLRAVLG